MVNTPFIWIHIFPNGVEDGSIENKVAAEKIRFGGRNKYPWGGIRPKKSVFSLEPPDGNRRRHVLDYYLLL